METIIEGKSYNIRPLTRGEIKQLRKKGLELANLSQDKADDAIDAVIGLVLPDRVDEIDGLSNTVALGIFKNVVELTYGGRAEKN